ncbi:bifunctional [glutamate--ammonia ligase]-adenylyl-L-tyrosine phosphorylase/[glutamate--ammonia-ligase] adenylyltransferase [Pontixanthobacter sp.]|uniref:bifunctional [glutamate--ammonia ligase]-adenylyl-L-tyrosine phosphorylase/[glutamate--ammonia-ligase] adenylyltransferase n=1 Tax=Pontixanthobacter sp. TaxID=2792078 RepID=UPI003C7B084F
MVSSTTDGDWPEGDWQSALARAQSHSPFLRGALARQPELAALLAEGNSDAALALALIAGEGTSDTGMALRREKLALGTVLAIGDLAGAYPVDFVMQHLSDFADRALHTAIAAVIARRVPDSAPAGLIGIALGKHGAGELNYSSDIDPILLYDPDTLPRRARDEPGDAAQRYARQIVQLLSDVTAQGYVFRVDLRLRPASEVSPLAISTPTALSHYESSALAWERAAFIRARAAAGDIPAGEAFLDAITPFVWRRSLDFGAIDEITRLTMRIREAYQGPLVPFPEYNLKQGRGGIRETEFYAQTHQLIHGGRDPSLRSRRTRQALDALAASAIIDPEDATALGDAYDALRVIEHRLQMVNDHQTHSLPGGAALDNVAALSGYRDSAALLAHLESITCQVAQRFDRLIDAQPPSGAAASAAQGSTVLQRISQLGLAEPHALTARIAGWTDGHIRALKSSAAVAAFEAILPALLDALAAAPDPQRAVVRWEDFLRRTSSAVNLFRLLEARPGLFDQLIRILTLADPLADDLVARSELFDTLVDQSALALPDTPAAVAGSMLRPDLGHDYERTLDRIRIVTGEIRFALGVQLIEAVHDPLDIAAGLSRLAEAAMLAAASSATEEFASVHGAIPGSELAIVGLGRLGGGALTHSSDLDIIYLFSGAFDAVSDGQRPLGATLYYNRLAQRISAALSVPTAQGALYEVDTRLRPQGAQGPLAVSIDSFAKYQREDAWTWEHMALSRARVMTGSPAIRAELDRTIADILRIARDGDALHARILAMRNQMAQHKTPKGPLDVKLLRGGLVDLEFMVHYLQLKTHTGLVPDLGRATRALAGEGLLPDALVHAHDVMTRFLVAARLLAPGLEMPVSHTAAAQLAKSAGCRDPNALSDVLTAIRRDVAECWQQVFGEILEIDR